MIRALFACALALLPVAAPTVASAIEIEEVTSPGGIRAWLVEEPSIPFVALDIRIRGGANLESPDKRGATNLMMATLEEGSGDMDARAFQAAREDLAASFGFDASDDAVGITATMLSENRDEAVALLRQAIEEPRFDEDAVERVRAQVLSGLASDAQDPGTIASDAFAAAVFGDHPYGSSLDGTPETVGRLTADDLRAAHHDALVRSRVYVGAVGDITAEELGPLLDELLGALPADGPALPPRVEPRLPGGVQVIDYPTPQAVAVFGQEGIDRDDPDWFAAFILDHVLGGGGFESRLMNEVREKRGLTYGIGTGLVPRDLAATWMGSVASDNATVAEAVEVVRGIWADVAANGITAEELDRAKRYLTGEYPLRFDGNADIAAILVAMQMIGLPPSYVEDRNGYVEAVTLDDVNRVARGLMDPERLTVVVVGQPEGLEPTPGDGPDAAPAPASEGAGTGGKAPAATGG